MYTLYFSNAQLEIEMVQIAFANGVSRYDFNITMQPPFNLDPPACMYTRWSITFYDAASSTPLLAHSNGIYGYYIVHLAV